MKEDMPRLRASVAAAVTCLLGVALTGGAAAHAADITVDLTSRGGSLKKPGLGSLFGVSSLAGGPPGNLLDGSVVTVSASQGRIGENGSNPFSTEAVAPLIRGHGIKMICRFNDLCYGFPYAWPGYTEWMRQVDAATRAVSGSYKDVVLCIAPLNEPDNKLNNSAFMTDPQVQGSTYDQRINWLWTQTVQKIRSIDASLPIMGPNYENYRPWEDSSEQTRMQNFLQNAISTGTVPDIIGWHSLGASPGDVPAALTGYYRPLEAQLNLPGRPKKICVEEYGPGSGDFEGVPGTILKHWADLERYGVDFGSMGIYANGGLLGNTLRFPWQSSPSPNGGWYLMNWYSQMQGQYVPVSRWDTRYYQAFDGVASWDPNARVVTLLVGGSDDDADIHLNGVGGLGIGTTVRVRLDCVPWSVDPNQADQTVEHGGDPLSGPYNLFDKNFSLDGSGNLTIPLHRIEGYNGYRLLISPASGPDSYLTKYEAESAARNHVTVHGGTDGLLASGGAYVGGIDYADSYVEFTVNAPSRGIYTMAVRYANGTSSAPATHNLTVNGVSQGAVTYPYTTTGWSNAELRTATKRVALESGANTIRLSKGTGNVEIDCIDVRPDTHRYDAEFATVFDATKYTFANEINVPNYVGGINNSDSYVEFAVDAPKAGSYHLTVAYANGTGGSSTHQLLINGSNQGSVTYPATGGWLGAADPRTTERTVSVPVTLAQGVNKVRLQKGAGYAELDYIALSYP